jgi:HD-like signal output (HDOD) protein
MGLINVVELKPDMVLANAFVDRNGRFLLSRGTKLTPKHLRVLKIWGAIEADIEGVSQEALQKDIKAQQNPALMEEAEKVIRERFVNMDLNHPATKELFRICTLRKAEEMVGSKQVANPAHNDSSEINYDGNDIPEITPTRMNPAEIIRKNEINLSTLPSIFMQINETIKRPNSSANDIANVISKDTALSARLLKIVNSPFYGFPSKIDTLSRAVSIVGTRQLTALAMGINITSVFKKIPNHLIDMRSFWEHSVACGIFARILGGYKNIQNTERLFVAGLLHDIGRLTLYNYSPVNARNALLIARQTNSLLYEIERETLGFDHTELGELLLKKWRLPISLENIVKYHHAPHESNDPLEPAIVHLADLMTIALGIGSSGERFVPPLSTEAWESLGLSPNILSSTINQTDLQIEETLQFF